MNGKNYALSASRSKQDKTSLDKFQRVGKILVLQYPVMLRSLHVGYVRLVRGISSLL